MIEQYAPAIIAASAALNALWLLGAFLTTRRSKRRWLWRAPAMAIATLAIVWTVRMTTITPRPSHTLRAGPGDRSRPRRAGMAPHTPRRAAGDGFTGRGGRVEAQAEAALSPPRRAGWAPAHVHPGDFFEFFLPVPWADPRDACSHRPLWRAAWARRR
ncbi:MAG: hypothetical protein ACFHWZ_05610 [Phycisphaerales bacterium]